MKDSQMREKIGEEAVMLKYIGEKFYNTRLNKNIISGREDKYDLSGEIEILALTELSE